MRRQTWSPDVAALGDRIAGLTAAGAAELSAFLEIVHGLRPASLPVLPDVDPDRVVEPRVVVPTEFDVVVDSYDAARKIALIRILREMTGLGLKEAVALTMAFPGPIKERLPRSEAEEIQARLEAAGAKVTLRPAA